MNRKITLTGGRKMMNMAKLGIVSRDGNYFHSLGKRQKQRAGGLMRYTLCVFQGKARRNGSRHSFAFDIPAISGQAQMIGECVLALTGWKLIIAKAIGII